jgi:hypothetical protein
MLLGGSLGQLLRSVDLVSRNGQDVLALFVGGALASVCTILLYLIPHRRYEEKRRRWEIDYRAWQYQVDKIERDTKAKEAAVFRDWPETEARIRIRFESLIDKKQGQLAKVRETLEFS